MYKVLYFDTFAKYYQAIGAYQQASDYIDTTLTMLKKDFTSDYAEQLLRKGRIWKQAGQSGKAIPLYEQALAIKDSTATVLSNNQDGTDTKQITNIEKTRTGSKKGKQPDPAHLSDLYICYPDSAFYLYGTTLYGTEGTQIRGKRNRKTTENVRKTNEIKSLPVQT